MIVLDASVVVEILLATPTGRELAEDLLAGGRDLHAPQLLDVEVLHALRRYWLSGDLDDARGHDATTALSGLPIERHHHDLLRPRIWQLRSVATAYDAAYLALAELLDADLLTRDARLAKTSGHRARIEVV